LQQIQHHKGFDKLLKTRKMKTELLEKRAIIKSNFADLLAGGITYNQIIVEQYKIETGCNIFKTFKQWKIEGFKVIKGSKGFPVFSKPSTKLKEEQGKEIKEGERSFFFTAYLFNESQVEKVN
jgi:hypothetical protein